LATGRTSTSSQPSRLNPYFEITIAGDALDDRSTNIRNPVSVTSLRRHSAMGDEADFGDSDGECTFVDLAREKLQVAGEVLNI